MSDPEHYTFGDIECIDAMKACSSETEFRGFCKLSALKYLWRAGRKGCGKEDMQKAIWYSRMAIGDDPRPPKIGTCTSWHETFIGWQKCMGDESHEGKHRAPDFVLEWDQTQEEPSHEEFPTSTPDADRHPRDTSMPIGDDPRKDKVYDDLGREHCNLCGVPKAICNHRFEGESSHEEFPTYTPDAPHRPRDTG